MKVASYIFFAIAVIVALVGVYSILVLRENIGGASGTFVVALFIIGTLLPLFVGIGLRGIARDEEEDE